MLKAVLIFRVAFVFRNSYGVLFWSAPPSTDLQSFLRNAIDDAHKRSPKDYLQCFKNQQVKKTETTNEQSENFLGSDLGRAKDAKS